MVTVIWIDSRRDEYPDEWIVRLVDGWFQAHNVASGDQVAIPASQIREVHSDEAELFHDVDDTGFVVLDNDTGFRAV